MVCGPGPPPVQELTRAQLASRFPVNIRELDLTTDTLDGGTALINEVHQSFARASCAQNPSAVGIGRTTLGSATLSTDDAGRLQLGMTCAEAGWAGFPRKSSKLLAATARVPGGVVRKP